MNATCLNCKHRVQDPVVHEFCEWEPLTATQFQAVLEMRARLAGRPKPQPPRNFLLSDENRLPAKPYADYQQKPLMHEYAPAGSRPKRIYEDGAQFGLKGHHPTSLLYKVSAYGWGMNRPLRRKD